MVEVLEDNKKEESKKEKNIDNNNNFNNISINQNSFDNSFDKNFFNVISQNNNKNKENNNNSQKNSIINIISQNCYQIKIENMINSVNSINPINNTNPNYNIISNDNNKNLFLEISKKSDNNNQTNNKNIDYSDYNDISINDLLNNIKNISESQTGCRLLQSKLEQNLDKADDFYIALEEKNLLKKTVLDTFGNYFIQKLLEYISFEKLENFFNNIICSSFVEICLNQHGSRVIQKLLDKIYKNDELVTKFNEYLKKYMLEIILNQSSTHIIIKYISLIKYPNNQIIYNFIIQNIYFIATHKHSCCTLQKCLEAGNETQKKEILTSLAKISNRLFSDQYGNYAIQFALSLKDEEANKIIIFQYLSEFNKNISNKISSNVYEKILEYSDFNTKQNIIKNLCNINTVKNLLFDTYGNYVLQKTVLAANEPYRSKYIKYIAPLMDGLRNFPNGLIIMNKLLTHFPELQNYSRYNNNFSDINMNNNYGYIPNMGMNNGGYFNPVSNYYNNFQNVGNVNNMY